jgi:hypothetical protein
MAVLNHNLDFKLFDIWIQFVKYFNEEKPKVIYLS